MNTSPPPFALSGRHRFRSMRRLTTPSKSPWLIAIGLAATTVVSAQTTYDLRALSSSALIGGSYFIENDGISVKGTGAADLFLAIQKDGSEQGYNSTAANFADTQSASTALLLSSLTAYNVSGTEYYGLALGLNQNVSANGHEISLDTFQIYVSSAEPASPNTLASLMGAPDSQKVYDLDGLMNSSLLLDYSAVGRGNSTPDYYVLIPKSLFPNQPNWNVTVYAGYGEYGAVDPNFKSSDGFESALRLAGDYTFVVPGGEVVPPPVPEASTLAGVVFAAGILLTVVVRRRSAAPWHAK